MWISAIIFISEYKLLSLLLHPRISIQLPFDLCMEQDEIDLLTSRNLIPQQDEIVFSEFNNQFLLLQNLIIYCLLF